MTWLTPTILEGKTVKLIPLEKNHCAQLIEAVQDGQLWQLGYFATIPPPDLMEKEIERRLNLQNQGLMLPFSVLHLPSNRIIGMTTYCQIDSQNKRLDIGFTWYARSFQRTNVNTECKLLLLTHAFEKLEVIAVGFKADYLNKKSQRAIERLGAKYEGMIRNYAIVADGFRDVCLYSILPNEWPRIKLHLNRLLEKNSEK